MIWKTRFSHLGYHSVDVAMDIPKEEKEPLRILKTCYDGNKMIKENTFLTKNRVTSSHIRAFILSTFIDQSW